MNVHYTKRPTQGMHVEIPRARQNKKIAEKARLRIVAAKDKFTFWDGILAIFGL